MRFGIVVFPGTWSDTDCFRAVHDVLGCEAKYIWHKDYDLSGIDAVIIPGGFSYGDYLRTGAIARFSPVMGAVQEFASAGGVVLGICNGFQILCEAQLLPGALLRNDSLQFRCQWVNLKVERTNSVFTNTCASGQVLRVPISHGEGRYYCDPGTLERIERSGQILFRYCTSTGETNAYANPNGSLNNIAGVVNEHGNVFGMMPHPERCCESLLGGTDGLFLFRSMLESALAAV
jgi:phosphoribosylformylglycinamidine synthase I